LKPYIEFNCAETSLEEFGFVSSFGREKCNKEKFKSQNRRKINIVELG